MLKTSLTRPEPASSLTHRHSLLYLPNSMLALSKQAAAAEDVLRIFA